MKACPTQSNLRLAIVAIFACLVAVVHSTGASLDSQASAPGRMEQLDKLKDSRFIAEGAKLFAPNCSSGYCHGAGGTGGGGPRLRGKGFDTAYLFKVISNGIPGTPMPAFKTELSEEQIWKLVAFIASEVKVDAEAKTNEPAMSSNTPAKTAPPATSDSTIQKDSTETSSLIGNAQAGKSLFYDSAQPKSCRSCHSFQGEGASIATDLSRAGGKATKELFLSIIFPRKTDDSRYSKLLLTLKNGDKIAGIKKEEDAESIRMYDITELPAVLRTIQKADIARTETAPDSAMPKDYASIYTLKQLLDIVAFLKSSEPQSKPVTLKDLF